MKSYFLYLLAFVLSSICPAYSKGQDYAVSQIPSNLLSNASAVMREDLGIIEMKSHKEATFKVRQVITFFKETPQYSKFYVSYDKFSKIKNLKANYYDASGKLIRKVSKDEIADVAAYDGVSLLSDNRNKIIENKYTVYPYTFELEYEEEWSAIRSLPSWYFQQFGVAVQKSEYIITVPADLKLNHRVKNFDLVPHISTFDKRTTYHWIVGNVEAVSPEPLMQSKILGYIQVTPERIAIEDFEGEMSNWKKFGQFLYDLNKDRDNISPDLAAKVKNMIASATTDRDKIDILYRYVQQNTRYVSIQLGIGGWQSFDAQYVEKNKYGDCKALSNFMKALLKVAGIKSNLVVISAGEDNFYNPDSLFCNALGFNHMILYVPTANMWLECTSTDNPTGYLGSFTQGRRALVITEEGGKLMTTPVMNWEHNTQTSQTTIIVNENGSASLKNVAQLRGGLHDDWRMIASNKSKEDIKKDFQNNSNLPPFTFQQFDIKVEKDQPEATLTYDISIEKYAAKSGTRLFVPINLHNAFADTPPATEKRLHPIEAGGSGYAEKDDITIQIPDGFDIENYPTKPLTAQSNYGNFSINIEKSENQLIIKRQLEIRPVSIPAEKFNEFRDFYKKIQQADATKVVLKKKA